MHVCSERDRLRILAASVFAAAILSIGMVAMSSKPADAQAQCRRPNPPCITSLSDRRNSGRVRITIKWTGDETWDHYNIRQGPSTAFMPYQIEVDGWTPNQLRGDHSRTHTFSWEAVPNGIYAFAVQGCDARWPAASSCSRWSSPRVLHVLTGTCKPGFVWREVVPADRVCVTPERRETVRIENAIAWARIQPGTIDICKPGFVWREAVRGDRVCVVPRVRDATRIENARAAQNSR